jgi:hypothetical protein
MNAEITGDHRFHALFVTMVADRSARPGRPDSDEG